MNYLDFEEQTVESFQSIQDEFKKKYNLEAYDSWFYNSITGLLTLSTDQKEINFKYIPIGTFSNNTETWMWTWNKEDSTEKNIKATLEIKNFGIKNNFEKLIKGHFDSDKYDGWAFVAIANKILNGIGGYMVNTDHLEFYMLLTELVDNQKANYLKSRVVDCSTHGSHLLNFVCQHLFNSENQGFEEAFPTYKGMELEEDEEMQAWCDACEIERLKTDGWNDESMKFAKIKGVCESCYFEIKEKNFKK